MNTFSKLYKVEASIVNHVHLITHYGHVMPTQMRPIFFRGTKLMFMCWQLVFNYPHHGFDKCCSEEVALR